MQTASLLGASLADHEPLKLLEQLNAGLPASTLSRFKRATGLADADVASVLKVSLRTFSRLKASRSRLSTELSDRLYAIASVYALAEEVLGHRERAQVWFAESQYGLAGKPPRSLLGTELGRMHIRGLLQRIEHGFLA